MISVTRVGTRYKVLLPVVHVQTSHCVPLVRSPPEILYIFLRLCINPEPDQQLQSSACDGEIGSKKVAARLFNFFAYILLLPPFQQIFQFKDEVYPCTRGFGLCGRLYPLCLHRKIICFAQRHECFGSQHEVQSCRCWRGALWSLRCRDLRTGEGH